MKIKPIKQRDEDACGPTSIEMVAKYFKMPITAKEIAKISQYKEREGLSNNELVQTLKDVGLKVETKTNTSWEDLMNLNSESHVIILSWMFKGYIGHFSLLEHVTTDKIYLVDPHFGKIREMDKIQFMRLWFDYDELWYPEKNTDIQLRWMAIVSKK